jgi:hypothetical protein
VGKSKFGGAPDGLALEDYPDGARFVGQLSREDVGLKKFAMAYFFVKNGSGLVLLGGGGPRSKPKKDDTVYTVSLGEGRNVLTPLKPTATVGTPKCDRCGRETRFLAELAALEDLGVAGTFCLFSCAEECGTASATAISQQPPA